MPNPDTGIRFAIRRPVLSLDTRVAGVDGRVKTMLDELDALLGKRVFAQGNARGGLKIAQTLGAALTPKRIPPLRGVEDWAPGSLADTLDSAAEGKNLITLSEHVQRTSEILKLKLAFQSQRQDEWLHLDFNTRAVLEGHENIENYLIARAYHLAKLRDAASLHSYILKPPGAVKDVADYALASAARKQIEDEKLNVPQANLDQDPWIAQLLKSKIPFSAKACAEGIKNTIKPMVFDSYENGLINNSVFAPVEDRLRPALVRFIKSSPYKITPQNIDFHMSDWLAAAYGAGGPSGAVLEPLPDDQDFNVQFQDVSTPDTADISIAAVRCASLLYHGMVMGDELDLFGAVNYFTHKYLVRGGLEIKDPRLRMDLRNYVFSDTFVDLKDNRVTDRTRPAERQMFYRQVFNEGAAEVTEDVLVNVEFKRLWKVLIYESYKYLKEARESFYPDNFVSRQKVMQAVEDLQYNLSMNCTGMANVIAPLIDAELNFVLTRIFSHPEVVRHVSPSGGGWRRVVETLLASMKRTRIRATTLHNKATQGKDILRAVADYTPATFEDDDVFSNFISCVDAFITTQSILQNAAGQAPPEEAEGAAEHGDASETADGSAEQPAPAAAAGDDEWNF